MVSNVAEVTKAWIGGVAIKMVTTLKLKDVILICGKVHCKHDLFVRQCAPKQQVLKPHSTGFKFWLFHFILCDFVLTT